MKDLLNILMGTAIASPVVFMLFSDSVIAAFFALLYVGIIAVLYVSCDRVKMFFNSIARSSENIQRELGVW